jgi:C1A family cysteine protease
MNLSKLYRVYPVVKDAPDPRDLAIAPLNLPPATESIVDLREWCGPIKDQGQGSSCTAHAASSMREFLYRKYYDQETNKTVAPKDFILSPQYLYYREREFEGDPTQDAGAQMRTAAKMLNNVGTCLLSEDPYNISAFGVAPNPAQIAAALTYKSGSYHRINGGLEEMKSVLASGYTFILGMNVFESFEDDYTARTGIMLIPNINTEKCMGGHAVHVCGYNSLKQVLIIANSWNTTWGNNGYFYMPYSVASNTSLVTDCWINHLGGKWGTPQQIAQVIQADAPYAAPDPLPTTPFEPAHSSEPQSPMDEAVHEG